MTTGFTQYGFERDNLLTIYEQQKLKLKAKFGNNISVADDNIGGYLAGIMAENLDQCYQYIEAAMSAFTINAEGVSLDNLIGPYTKRQGSEAGSGTVFVITNSSCPNNYILSSGAVLKTQNNKQYTTTQDYLLTENVSAYELNGNDLIVTTYTFTIKNTTDNNFYSWVWNLTNTSQASKNEMLYQLGQFFLLHTTGNEGYVQLDTTNSILRLGFNSALEAVGWSESTEWRSTPVVGTKYNAVTFTCTTKGYYPLPANSVSSLSPSFTGLVGVSNPNDFSSGSNPETDAAYLARHYATINSVGTGTRNSVVSAILALDGVEAVKVYRNTTASDTVYADAYTFNTCVLGGDSQQIAEAIYTNKPIDSDTSGSISRTVVTADDDVETIRFTVADVEQLNIKIEYSTLTRVPLTDTEQIAIMSRIQDLMSTYTIGSRVYNTQLISSVLSALTSQRITDITVKVKKVSADNGAYSSSTFNTDFNKKPAVENANIVFTMNL